MHPGTRHIVDVERCFFQVQRRIDLVTKRGRQDLVVECHRRLDHGCGPGGGDAVADHRFDRADTGAGQVGLGTAGTEHRAQRLDFGLVTQRDARAVGFDQSYGGRVDIAGSVGALQGQHLTFEPGRQQALGLAVG